MNLLLFFTWNPPRPRHSFLMPYIYLNSFPQSTILDTWFWGFHNFRWSTLVDTCWHVYMFISGNSHVTRVLSNCAGWYEECQVTAVPYHLQRNNNNNLSFVSVNTVWTMYIQFTLFWSTKSKQKVPSNCK